MIFFYLESVSAMQHRTVSHNWKWCSPLCQSEAYEIAYKIDQVGKGQHLRENFIKLQADFTGILLLEKAVER